MPRYVFDAICFVYTCRRLIDLSLIEYTCRRLIDLSLIAGDKLVSMFLAKDGSVSADLAKQLGIQVGRADEVRPAYTSSCRRLI